MITFKTFSVMPVFKKLTSPSFHEVFKPSMMKSKQKDSGQHKKKIIGIISTCGHLFRRYEKKKNCPHSHSYDFLTSPAISGLQQVICLTLLF